MKLTIKDIHTLSEALTQFVENSDMESETEEHIEPLLKKLETAIAYGEKKFLNAPNRGDVFYQPTTSNQHQIFFRKNDCDVWKDQDEY